MTFNKVDGSQEANATAIPSKFHLLQKNFKTLGEQPAGNVIADSWMTTVVSVEVEMETDNKQALQ